jgi:hypothetical protein
VLRIHERGEASRIIFGTMKAMTKKRLVLIAVFPLAVALTLGVLAMLPAMLPPIPGVTKANFDRIEVGMTKTEVQAILGSDSQPAPFMFGGTSTMVAALSTCNAEAWCRDDGAWARIIFDNADVVISKDWIDSSENTLETIRRWLHLR